MISEQLLLGISVDFDVHCTIPESSIEFNYKGKGEPEDDINNVENIQDGYKKMTQACFVKFYTKQSAMLGLYPIYESDE